MTRGAPRGGARRALALVALACAAAAAEPARSRVPWEAWEAPAFARAQVERRIVLGVVSTSWCHWCHVMQRETYADPRVERAVARAFLPVQADGDARPDLAERFRRYRWPATAFFTPDGVPVLALRGYRSADELLAILEDVERLVRAGGPYPGFEAPPLPRKSQSEPEPDRAALESLHARLVAQLDGSYDTVHQGWGRGQKYPLAEPVLWGLRRALTQPGDARPLRRSMDTLAASEALIDPVWGGMFQYSVGPDWNEPHYEKIMAVNAGALASYARAFALSGNARWKRDAERVKAWFERFLSAPDGTFHASQDAEVGGQEATAYHRLDDAGRRRIGVPRVDSSVYARENGQAIQAYVAWALAGDDAAALARAVRAAERVLATHGEPDGLLRHAAGDAGRRLYLLDQAEVGLALLALARATGEPRWTAAAERLGRGLVVRFTHPDGGLCDATWTGDGTHGSLEANAQAARFLLGAAVAAEHRGLATAALRALAALDEPAYLEAHGRHVGTLLLAVEEALARPRRVTLRGDPADPRHAALRDAAVAAAARDPALWLVGVAGPGERPFAVVCSPDGACSDPVEEAAALTLLLAAGAPR